MVIVPVGGKLMGSKGRKNVKKPKKAEEKKQNP